MMAPHTAAARSCGETSDLRRGVGHLGVNGRCADRPSARTSLGARKEDTGEGHRQSAAASAAVETAAAAPSSAQNTPRSTAATSSVPSLRLSAIVGNGSGSCAGLACGSIGNATGSGAGAAGGAGSTSAGASAVAGFTSGGSIGGTGSASLYTPRAPAPDRHDGSCQRGFASNVASGITGSAWTLARGGRDGSLSRSSLPLQDLVHPAAYTPRQRTSTRLGDVAANRALASTRPASTLSTSRNGGATRPPQRMASGTQLQTSAAIAAAWQQVPGIQVFTAMKHAATARGIGVDVAAADGAAAHRPSSTSVSPRRTHGPPMQPSVAALLPAVSPVSCAVVGLGIGASTSANGGSSHAGGNSLVSSGARGAALATSGVGLAASRSFVAVGGSVAASAAASSFYFRGISGSPRESSPVPPRLELAGKCTTRQREDKHGQEPRQQASLAATAGSGQMGFGSCVQLWTPRPQRTPSTHRGGPLQQHHQQPADMKQQVLLASSGVVSHKCEMSSEPSLVRRSPSASLMRSPRAYASCASGAVAAGAMPRPVGLWRS